MEKTTSSFHAPDIECDGCANAIRKVLGRVEGVSEVTVDVEQKTVAVEHDPQQAPRAALTAALDRAGFPVSG